MVTARSDSGGSSPGDRGALVIFARMDSRRLPGKVLADLGGRPLLGRLVDRLRRVPASWPILLATSTEADDDDLARFAEREAIGLFRGDKADVLGRAVACADQHRLDWLGRICGDSPFQDPRIVAAVVELFRRCRPDLATNVWPRGFPAGCSVEIIAAAALRRAAAAAAIPEDREHMTRHFYQTARHYRIVNHPAPDPRYRDLSLAVDEPADLERARGILARLTDPAGADLDTVLAARDAA
jgi:spore coat polysaccharide biosynthesis protein SpsF